MVAMIGRWATLGAATTLLLAGCAASSDDTLPPAAAAPTGEPSVQVLAAFYPYYWVAQRVGGPAAAVELLTAPGVEPHDMELSPRQVQQVGETGLVIYQKGFQPALDAAVEQQKPAHVLEAFAVLGREPVVDDHGHGTQRDPHAGQTPGAHTEEGHDEVGHSDEEREAEGHDHAADDPAADAHLWLDPDNLAAIATATADAMSRLHPPGAAEFQTRAGQVRSDLAALDQEYRTGLTGCARDDVVVNHAAFGHLTSRYGLTQVPVNGITPEAEPTPQRLAELAELIRREGATTVFTETLASPRLAETLASEAGVQTATLDPLEGLTADDNRDYLSVMHDNLVALRTGLDCTGTASVSAAPSTQPSPTATPSPDQSPSAGPFPPG